MDALVWLLGIGMICGIIWLFLEYVVDRMFEINDLKDDDYGC